MRNEYEVELELMDTKEKYLAARAARDEVLYTDLSAKVKTLQAELSAIRIEGANPCPNCGNMPHGMKRNKGFYEVGCLACASSTIKGTGPTYRATGEYIPQVVARWNAGEYTKNG